MKLCCLLPLFAAAIIAYGENEIGFVEKFALAADREKVLTTLIPGTEDYYFYHALHFQNTKQTAKLGSILDQWRKRFRESERRKIIENREALLAYDADPQRTLKFLKDFLKPNFDHIQERRDRKPGLPTALDPQLVTRDVFLAKTLEDDELKGVHPETLARMIVDKVPLRPSQRRAALSRLQRPNVPGLVELVSADLESPESRGFGEFEIHRQLLPEQLDALAKLMPALAEQGAFVMTRLRKLLPGADEDMEFNLAAREAWLERSWAYAKTLPPAFNTIKAAILRQRLELDRRLGVLDRERFIEYLKLPRRMGYMNPRWLDAPTQAEGAVDLNAQPLREFANLPPVGNDEQFVRELFLQLFEREERLDPIYGTYIRDTWIKKVFAEAKIVSGSGDPEKWASMLSPDEYQRLRERVDLDFASTSPAFLAPGDDVRIEVFVKNAPKLIVKVYELNALNYFLTHRQQLNTDLPLDGLIANKETTHSYDDPSVRRVKRTFSFPELKGRRGAWMIEFIGGGRSSRALIRKGQWHLIQKPSLAGDLLVVLDENRQPVRDAVAWLDGRKFTTDEEFGAILVPFTAQPGPKAVVLTDVSGAFATLTDFEHHAESYQLHAQFFVDREQLLAGREAVVAVRAALSGNGSEMPLTLLENPRLTITTTTLDGIVTSKDFAGLKVDAARVMTQTIPVPDRLAQLTATLTGQVEQLSKDGEKLTLTATRSWTTNGIDRTEATFSGHLTKFDGNYVLEVLGKNGEPIPDQQVVFTFERLDLPHTVDVALGTDDRGRIALGSLAGVKSVSARLSSNTSRFWALSEFDRTLSDTVHAMSDSELHLPLCKAAVGYSVLETRHGAFVADVTQHVVPPANEGVSHLTLKGLPPGDYVVNLPGEFRSVNVKITQGIKQSGWVFGDRRILELSEAVPLNIARIDVNPTEMVIALNKVNRFTRIHVAATRFIDPLTRVSELSRFPRIGVSLEVPARLPNLFAAGREIGDEYRYILDRRDAKKFPGNMLARPGLLLNPWDKRNTDQAALDQAAMQAPTATAGARGRQMVPPAAQKPAPHSADALNPTDPNFDFFTKPSVVLYNLIPDAGGVIRVDRKTFGDQQFLQIYAEDLNEAVWRDVALPEVEAKHLDIRLTRGLDPAKSFAEKKQITILEAGQTLILADRATSRLETYDTLASVFSLFQTLNRNDTLLQFSWVLDWPKLSDQEKRVKYSEFACHELNFFLSRKDLPFFETVIRPYLRNKKDKTFLDNYLLDGDMHAYLEPWKFSTLNAAERALLAMRLKVDASDIARHLRESWELIPPDADEQDRLFTTALFGRAMDETTRVVGALAEPSETAELMLPNEPVSEAATDSPRSTTVPEDALRRPLVGKDGRESLAKQKARNMFLEFGDRAGELDRFSGSMLEEKVAKELRVKAKEAAYYRRLGPTKEWAENNYYRLPIGQQGAELIAVNAFWRDFAGWIADGAKRPFLSPNFAEAHHNFSEMMLALAVLDLPFEAAKHSVKIDGATFVLTAGGPIIAFHKEIKPAQPAGQSDLLVSQNFFRHGDRYRNEGNERFDKYVMDEFLAGVVYGANVVVTNPSSSPQKLELLLQIPRGSLPVLGSKSTDSRRIQLEPFMTKSFEYFFYFPIANEGADDRFPHYPVQVVRAEQVAGAAKPFTFRVVRQLSRFDKASWDYVSQYGDEAEVFAFLDQSNLGRLDLERIAWRCRKDVEFLRKIVAVLAKRRHFDPTIYSYGLYHNDFASLRDWLRHQDELLGRCGLWLDSKLVRIDPTERGLFEHLEYSPLVNQRAHRLGVEARIADNVVLAQYRRFLEILAHKPTLDPADSIAVTGFLFLQDRVEEAIERLRMVKPESLSTKLQYDYFEGYAALYEGDLPAVRKVATSYANHPVDRWRNRFAELAGQLDEIEGNAGLVANSENLTNRERGIASSASKDPSFALKVENRTIYLTWKNLTEAMVNYYLIDPEFSFSSNPFVGGDPGRFSIIRPAKSGVIELPKDRDTLEMPLPNEFANANLVVEIVAAGSRKAQAYHSNSLKFVLAENFGRLEVRDQGSGKAVAKAYVKVYARLQDGTVRFFKDGYTDLRGRFDYASLNSGENDGAALSPAPGQSTGGLNTQMLRPGELDRVDRLSILVLSDTHGAIVKEAALPSE